MRINFTLNDRPVNVELPGDLTLLRLLREHMKLTGTKCGCDTGNCGACAVILDGNLVFSCLVMASRLDGRRVTTIEGIHGADGGLSEIQEAIVHHGGIQCGYCTPAMVLAGEAFLNHHSNPTRDEIREAISPVLCRCTGYQQIIDAIEEAARSRQFAHQTVD